MCGCHPNTLCKYTIARSYETAITAAQLNTRLARNSIRMAHASMCAEQSLASATDGNSSEGRLTWLTDQNRAVNRFSTSRRLSVPCSWRKIGFRCGTQYIFKTEMPRLQMTTDLDCILALPVQWSRHGLSCEQFIIHSLEEGLHGVTYAVHARNIRQCTHYTSE